MSTKPTDLEAWWMEASSVAEWAAACVLPQGPDRDALAASVADRLFASYRHVRGTPEALRRLAAVIARNADRAIKRDEATRRRLREHALRTGEFKTTTEEPSTTTGLSRAVHDAVSVLSDEERHLLTLRVEAGLGYAEMAAVTGDPISTLHQKFTRTIARLSEILKARSKQDSELRHLLEERGYLRQD